jgi:hypothetical protein
VCIIIIKTPALARSLVRHDNFVCILIFIGTFDFKYVFISQVCVPHATSFEVGRIAKDMFSRLG